MKLTASSKKTLMIVLSAVLPTITLFMCFFLLSYGLKDGVSAFVIHMLTMGTFIALAISRWPFYFKNPDKYNLIKTIVFSSIYIILGIFVALPINQLLFSQIAVITFYVTVVANRIFRIVRDHRVRSIISNLMIIAIFVLFIVLTCFDYEKLFASYIALFAITIAITSFTEVIIALFSQLKRKTLYNIFRQSYAIEILTGLLNLIVAFALVIYMYEDGFNNYGDALWYCFAVVTTIGFGDFTCTTVLGRILSVILGIYGVIVVALITSIIVNFYNETSKNKEEHMKELDEKWEEFKKEKQDKKNKSKSDENNIEENKSDIGDIF